jgi:transcriptional regulator with XRE-family HTH domain
VSLTSIDFCLRETLSDPAQRHEFFRATTQDDIATQIRFVRRLRGLTQAQLADRAGMKQSAISRIEQADYASWASATLFRVAAGLDARWRMVLEPCEEAIKEFAPMAASMNYIPGQSNIIDYRSMVLARLRDALSYLNDAMQWLGRAQAQQVSLSEHAQIQRIYIETSNGYSISPTPGTTDTVLAEPLDGAADVSVLTRATQVDSITVHQAEWTAGV